MTGGCFQASRLPFINTNSVTNLSPLSSHHTYPMQQMESRAIHSKLSTEAISIQRSAHFFSSMCSIAFHHSRGRLHKTSQGLQSKADAKDNNNKTKWHQQNPTVFSPCVGCVLICLHQKDVREHIIPGMCKLGPGVPVPCRV